MVKKVDKEEKRILKKIRRARKRIDTVITHKDTPGLLNVILITGLSHNKSVKLVFDLIARNLLNRDKNQNLIEAKERECFYKREENFPCIHYDLKMRIYRGIYVPFINYPIFKVLIKTRYLMVPVKSINHTLILFPQEIDSLKDKNLTYELVYHHRISTIHEEEIDGKVYRNPIHKEKDTVICTGKLIISKDYEKAAHKSRLKKTGVSVNLGVVKMFTELEDSSDCNNNILNNLSRDQS